MPPPLSFQLEGVSLSLYPPSTLYLPLHLSPLIGFILLAHQGVLNPVSAS